MATVGGKSVPERIAFWADWLQKDGRARYLFGLDPGGYVTEGRMCDDLHTDCVLFVYRASELGRSTSAREAVQFAFGTRFYSAGVEEAILPDGRVRYDIPAHLDYSEEIFRSSIWGQDATPTIGPVEPDPGNARFPAGSLSFVRKGAIDYAALRSGDIVFFLLDEKNPEGRRHEDPAGDPDPASGDHRRRWRGAASDPRREGRPPGNLRGREDRTRPPADLPGPRRRLQGDRRGEDRGVLAGDRIDRLLHLHGRRGSLFGGRLLGLQQLPEMAPQLG